MLPKFWGECTCLTNYTDSELQVNLCVNGSSSSSCNKSRLRHIYEFVLMFCLKSQVTI